jgi:formylglycine-generating enzyme required for sulfatase activity
VASCSLVACIDAPTFVLDESTTAVSDTRPVSGEEEDDAMVLVPATTLPRQGTLSPNAPGRGGKDDDDDDDDDKKGKGKGGGDDGGGADDEAAAPAEPSTASVSVPAFWIDVHEVSARAYAACVAEGKCTPAGAEPECTVAAGLGDHPVSCVSIDQARTFCVSRGKRLVRNDEWTAAAAGAELRPYPWGADAPSSTRLNASGDADGWARTAPVGSYPAGRSPQGVADLAGNVAEWVDVAGANLTRGGSHADDDVGAVSSLAVRTATGPDATIGLRCAKDR